jgi:hypothetical protein
MRMKFHPSVVERGASVPHRVGSMRTLTESAHLYRAVRLHAQTDRERKTRLSYRVLNWLGLL